MDIHILPGHGILATRDASRNGMEGVESRLVRPDGQTLLGWRAKKQAYVRLRWSEADAESIALYKYSSGEIHRTLEVRGQRLVGITAEGPWPGLRDASELLFSGEPLPGWMLALFHHLGDLEIGSRSAASRMVCTCAKVTRAKLLTLVDQGHHTMTSLPNASRAGRLCGACRPDMEAILHERTRGALLPHGGPPQRA
jgi:bacterioferritin-associated ferredoxin